LIALPEHLLRRPVTLTPAAGRERLEDAVPRIGRFGAAPYQIIDPSKVGSDLDVVGVDADRQKRPIKIPNEVSGCVPAAFCAR
jgi:hypothetical protein